MTIRNALRLDWVLSKSVVITNNKLYLRNLKSTIKNIQV